MTSVYNITSSIGIKIDHDTPINNRAKLDTGTFCNYDCGFCYYKSQLNVTTPFDDIKKRIDYLIECGIKEVDLSGGESSVHQNWFDILDYCSQHDLNISCLSNGYKFAQKEFLQKSKDKGLSEILFSLHGYDEDSHDTIVGRKNAYKHMIRAINNANDIGVIVRINCTVTNLNYNHLDKFIVTINKLKPEQVNFLPLNYWEDADKQETIDYDVISPYIHQAIDGLKGIVPEINVRYIPFCFMKGYEKHVVDYYQHIYDRRDWNIAVYNHDIDPITYRENPLKCLHEAANRNRVNTYYKTKDCLNCKHYHICDGVEKQIKEIKLYPENGDRITDVNYYRK